jgi:mannosyltransferase OCH1-like enzyme
MIKTKAKWQPNRRIYQIGFNRCGTKTLHNAFLENGIPSVHHEYGQLSKNIKENAENNRPLLEGYEMFQAFTDMEHVEDDGKFFYAAEEYYEEFYEQDPDGLFILNIRPIHTWINSRSNNLKGYLSKTMESHNMTKRQVLRMWEDEYFSHIKNVKKFFKEKDAESQLLIFDLEKDHRSKCRKFFEEFGFEINLQHFGRFDGDIEQTDKEWYGIPEKFNWEFYIKHNNLESKGINSEAKAWAHFIKEGLDKNLMYDEVDVLLKNLYHQNSDNFIDGIHKDTIKEIENLKEYRQKDHIPKIIHYCWFSDEEKPELVKKCIDSWKEHLPEYRVIEWNTKNFDMNMNEVTRDFFYKKQFAFLSDYIRFYIVYKLGGFYFDSDLEVLKPFDNFVLNRDFLVGYNDETQNQLGPEVFGAKKNNKHLEKLVDFYNNKEYVVGDEVKVCPELFTEIVAPYKNKDVDTLHSDYLFPLPWGLNLPMQTVEEEHDNFIKDKSYTFHWYAKSWIKKKEQGFNKDFDWTYYINTNKDVLPDNITNEHSALHHWSIFGKYQKLEYFNRCEKNRKICLKNTEAEDGIEKTTSNEIEEFLKTQKKGEIPKIIHYCWFGGRPKSPIILRSIQSWKKLLPDYKIVEWNERNFNTKLNKYTRHWHNNRNNAFLADYVRINVLNKYGGIYLDTDMEVVKNFDDLLNKKCFFGYETKEEDIIGNAVIAGVKGHNFFKEMIYYYETRNFKIGPFVIESILKNKDWKDVEILPYDYFFPISSLERYEYTNVELIEDIDKYITPDSYAFHWFLGEWCKKQHGQNKKFEWNSYLLANRDLKKNWNTPFKAWVHWQLFGRREGRML